MVWVSRVLLLLVFSLFWGGLTLYTGVVLRITHTVVNDPMEGGLITQRVTSVLQILGVVTVVLMVCNCVVVVRRSPKFGYVLIGCATLLAGSLIGLFLVHGQLDTLIEGETYTITDREAFDAGHQRYNQLTTVEWLACLVYLATTVFAWRSIDSDAVKLRS